MNELSPEQLKKVLNWRYACKAFDASKKISDSDWNALEEAMVLSPSSLGLQPWKFIVVKDAALREKLKLAAHGQTQIADASHLVVFAAKQSMDASYVEKFIARMIEVRGLPAEAVQPFKEMVLGWMSRNSAEYIKKWTGEQVMLAVEQLVLCAALMRIDSCILGGLDPVQYDELLGLKGTDYGTLVAVAVGYRSADDKYASMPKVRFKKEDILEYR